MLCDSKNPVVPCRTRKYSQGSSKMFFCEIFCSSLFSQTKFDLWNFCATTTEAQSPHPTQELWGRPTGSSPMLAHAQHFTIKSTIVVRNALITLPGQWHQPPLTYLWIITPVISYTTPRRIKMSPGLKRRPGVLRDGAAEGRGSPGGGTAMAVRAAQLPQGPSSTAWECLML